jgi:tetratricopeptide (TPR) repeat protein
MDIMRRIDVLWRSAALALLALLGVAAPLLGQDAHAHDGAGSGGEGEGLLDGLGSWHHEVATRDPRAQAFFDQGLRLAYGFNHDEAERSFREAARLDPGCTMCWWGVGYVLGPNINAPMEREGDALEATRRALATLGAGSDARERAYVEALAVRYGEPLGEERAARDSAYARAMEAVAARHADDPDARVLHAEALLLLRPWNQWTRTGTPQDGTLEVMDVLEGVIADEPEHAGACHYYIHTVEAGPAPEQALPCARALPELMPGAGHVVHMPAHVYLRTGRYLEAAEQNERATHADHAYLESRRGQEGIYPLFYAPHNVHFLWFARMTAGQRGEALAAADRLLDEVTPANAEAIPSLQAFRTARILTLARFHAWDEVRAEPLPDEARPYERALTHYARGLALAAGGEVGPARVELAALDAVRARTTDDLIIILNPAPVVLTVARELLDGVIARAEGDLQGAVDAFQRAVDAEDRLTYDEPPPWYQGARQFLGAALLEAGHTHEAEVAFRQDLLDLPRNAWSLAGLVGALERQDRLREASAYRAELRAAWRGADAAAPLILP